MDEEKKKEGISVKEMEGYAKKHRLEVFFCLLFALSSVFLFFFWGFGLSIFLAAAGGIVGILMPRKIEALIQSIFDFAFKQEGTTQLIIGIASLIVAIFLGPLVYLLMGLYSGKSMLLHAKEISSRHESSKPKGQ